MRSNRLFRWSTALMVSLVTLLSIPSWAQGASESEATSNASSSDRQTNSTESANFQFRSLKLGLGTGLQGGVDFYLGSADQLGLDAYVIPTIGGDCQAECFRRYHGQLTWGPTWGSKWVQAGLDLGLAGGHIHSKVDPESAWKGPAVGAMMGARTSWTPARFFSLGLDFALVPAYWFHSENLADENSNRTPNSVRFWVTGALVMEFGSVRSPAW